MLGEFKVNRNESLQSIPCYITKLKIIEYAHVCFALYLSENKQARKTVSDHLHLCFPTAPKIFGGTLSWFNRYQD